MNWWNAIYTALFFVVVATMPPATWVLIALCLLPVGFLWVGRWVTDWQRSQGRTAVLSGTGYRSVLDRSALADVFRKMGAPLRDWVMRGYPTGATQYWVRDAWCVEQAGLQFTAMEVHTTPGYMGTGIPLWRVRHCALVVQSSQVWPEFVLWRDPAAAHPSHQPGAKFQQHRMGRKYRLLPVQGFWVEAADPKLAWAQFSALWKHLGQPEDADLLAMAQGNDLVLFWRKRPPTGETLAQLLQGCLAYANFTSTDNCIQAEKPAF
ncbi:MAG: hypothetical protein RL710_3296 [Pseudomonadota bacterium]